MLKSKVQFFALLLMGIVPAEMALATKAKATEDAAKCEEILRDYVQVHKHAQDIGEIWSRTQLLTPKTFETAENEKIDLRAKPASVTQEGTKLTVQAEEKKNKFSVTIDFKKCAQGIFLVENQEYRYDVTAPLKRNLDNLDKVMKKVLGKPTASQIDGKYGLYAVLFAPPANAIFTATYEFLKNSVLAPVNWGARAIQSVAYRCDDYVKERITKQLYRNSGDNDPKYIANVSCPQSGWQENKAYWRSATRNAQNEGASKYIEYKTKKGEKRRVYFDDGRFWLKKIDESGAESDLTGPDGRARVYHTDGVNQVKGDVTGVSGTASIDRANATTAKQQDDIESVRKLVRSVDKDSYCMHCAQKIVDAGSEGAVDQQGTDGNSGNK